MSVNIGDLRGTISLEDQFSSAMTLVARRVQQSVGQLTGIFATVALGATVAATAVTGIASAIIGLGIKGSHLNDVEDSFKRLAGGAENATAIFKAMNTGVAGTVDSLVLMEMANRALSTGAIKTAQDFGTVTAAARVLARQGFGSVESVLNTVNSAMTTGRTRSLQYLTGVIDLKAAEEKYAKSLGTTRDALSAQGKLHAAQIAILESLNRKVAEAGDLQKSFAEKMTSARLTISNWFDDLAKAVAKSPQVNAALDAIGAALVKNFGGTATTVMDTIVVWINKFADAVTHYGPIIIGWMRKIVDGIVSIWTNVKQAWELVPDWFKNIAKDAALAGGAVYLTSKALTGLAGPDVLGSIASLATITSGTRDAFLSLALAIPIITRIGSAIQGLSIAEVALISMKALGASMLALATGPVGIAALFVAFGAAVWEVAKAIENLIQWWRAGKSMWEFFSARDTDNWVRRWLGLSKGIDATAESVKRLADQRKELEGLMGSRTGSGPAPRMPGAPPPSDGGDIDARTKEIETATQSSIEKTARLWDQYFDTVDKAATESLDIQLRALDRWYAAELSTLDKTKKDNVNYWNERAALGDLFYAKVILAEHEWTEKVVTESRARMAAFEAEAQKAVTAIAKGLSGQPDILRDMSAATATFTDELNNAADATHDLIAGSLLTSRAIEDVSMQGKLMATSYSDAEKAISDAMAAGVRGALPLTEKQKELIARMKELGFSAEEMAANLKVSLSQVRTELEGTTKALMASLKGIFTSLPETLMRAFEGGGDLVGAFKSLAVQIGNVFVDTLTAAFKRAAAAGQSILNSTTVRAAAGIGAMTGIGVMASSGSAKAATAAVGMSTAGVVASAALAKGATVASVTLLGAATLGVGLAAVGAYFAIKKLLSISKEEKAGREMAAEFERVIQSTLSQQQVIEAQGKSWAATVIGVRDAFLNVGKSAAEAETVVKRLWDAMREGPSAVQAVIDEIQGTLDVANAIRSSGFKSKSELMAEAQMANRVYEAMAASSEFTAEQITKAYRMYQEALAETGDAAAKAWLEANSVATSLAERAERAGYQTTAALRKAADDARALAIDMRDSGEFTADQVKDAFEKAADAAARASGLSAKLVSDLRKEFEDLSQSVEDEAPEEVMGVLERQARDRMAAIEAELAGTAAATTTTVEDAATETARIVGAATNDTRVAIDDMVTETADQTGKAMSDAAVVVSDAFKVAAEQIAVDIGDDTAVMMEVTAEGIKLVMADAALTTAEEFKGAGQAARRSFDKVEIRAGELAQEIDAIFSGLGYEIPVTFHVDTSALDGLGASIPVPSLVPVPMAAGGSGHAYGPMLFSTQGDEDWAFSGEGKRFGQAPSAANGNAPTITELHTHNHIDGREILPVFITAIQRDDRGVTTIIKRKVRGR